VKAAIDLYEKSGGAASIFVNDGTLLTSKDDMILNTEQKIFMELNKEKAIKVDTQTASTQTLINGVQIFDLREYMSTLVCDFLSWWRYPSSNQKRGRVARRFGSTLLSRTLKRMSASI
jgi:hypothetical protein